MSNVNQQAFSGTRVPGASQDVKAPVVQRRPRRSVSALFLGAFTVCFLLFLLGPIVVVVFTSFTSASYVVFPMPGFSFKWYARIVEYAPFLDSLIVSLQVAFASAVFGALLGVPAALWAARSRSHFAAAMSNFLLAPISVPAIVLGFSLLYMLSALSLGVSMLSLTHTVDNLPLSFFFGSPETNTLPVVMLSYMENQFDPSIAAISTVQMLIALAALAVVNFVYGIEKLTAA